MLPMVAFFLPLHTVKNTADTTINSLTPLITGHIFATLLNSKVLK
jgi:hypothetical protein